MTLKAGQTKIPGGSKAYFSGLGVGVSRVGIVHRKMGDVPGMVLSVAPLKGLECSR